MEKDRILIVAKTRMQQGICISALTRSENKGLRLRTPDGSCQPENTPFKVGQVWEIEYRHADRIVPPHVEDVCVLKQRYVGQQPKLSELLPKLIQPWHGGPEALFGGLLEMRNMTAYIGHDKGVPPGSTGFWLPTPPLTLVYRRGKPYYWLPCSPSQITTLSTETLSDHNIPGADGEQSPLASPTPSPQRLYIRYVGLADPLTLIAPQTLLRMSLARWWVPPEVDEERCYLQLSGWYLKDVLPAAPVSTGPVSSIHV